jgi:hypothetical protein
MRKTKISFVLALSLFIIALFSISALAGDVINILNYSLKPAGYVDGDKSLQTIWNIELQNTEATAHSFTIKIVFFDKEKKQIKESKKEYQLNASETKKFTDVVLVDATLAKQIGSTKAFIEDIK